MEGMLPVYGEFRGHYLNQAIEAVLVELVNPNNPTSTKQRYVLTALGKRLAEEINKH
ncbi:hypothetical protein JHJ32_13310 [Parapedobacter sp. ISTM3]|uniref:Fic family protein n=1 Tax=Parapedobacter sp. ISTM3 TaxID=2800130 RepID=UPI001907D2CA|nr:hypothetical protein [Parapedobacter sp. ISTM3]MBK1440972.1 hypothetical protein [Parapedobacter sp. ISTM3]